jgi:hypothetical protein
MHFSTDFVAVGAKTPPPRKAPAGRRKEMPAEDKKRFLFFIVPSTLPHSLLFVFDLTKPANIASDVVSIEINSITHYITQIVSFDCRQGKTDFAGLTFPSGSTYGPALHVVKGANLLSPLRVLPLRSLREMHLGTKPVAGTFLEPNFKL